MSPALDTESGQEGFAADSAVMDPLAGTSE
jgi:hypothetical protein